MKSCRCKMIPGKRLLALLLICLSIGGSLLGQQRRQTKPFEDAYGVLAGGGGIYMESMYLPPVTTGPWSPAWSPDGKQIAFAMQGSLWVVPPEGGIAVQLTTGPKYDGQPSWSPDGSQIAFTRDDGRAIQIWVANADGNNPRQVTKAEAVSVDPHWTPDGQSIVCTSSGQAKGNGFGLWQFSVSDGTPQKLLVDKFQNIEPSPSPDGNTIVFVSNRDLDGKEILGTGGIWKLAARGTQPTLLLQEETLWHVRPAWSPDGTKIVYVSFRTGSNQLWLMSATSGNPLQLTFGSSEVFTPAWSPDSRRIAFIANADGVFRLWTIPTIGGAPSKVAISGLKYRQPMGKVDVVIRDAKTGKPMPARAYVTAADGKSYTPIDSFHRILSLTNDHYFTTTGSFSLELPAGKATVEVIRGFEYQPQKREVEITSGQTQNLEISLTRIANLAAQGWYSGDNHIHMNYGGIFQATPTTLLREASGEDLNVVDDLIANHNTRIIDLKYFEGKLNSESTADRVLSFGQEYRYSYPGHLSLMNMKTFKWPSDVTPGSARQALYPDEVQILDQVHAEGGVGGLVHPFYGEGILPHRSKEFPVFAALKKIDYYDVMCIWSDEYNTADEWYRALNLGFRLPASAGTDAMTNYWRAPAIGTVRVYVHSGSPLNYSGWIHGLVGGRTFVTNGPMLLLKVNGREPGDDVALPAGQPANVHVSAEATSIFPMWSVDLIQNGKVIYSAKATDPHHVTIERDVPVESSGWIAARVTGTEKIHLMMDTYLYAHTSPVYLTQGGEPPRSVEDARYFQKWIEDMLPVIEAGDCQKRDFVSSCFDSPKEKEEILQIWRRARDVYAGMAAK